MVATKQKKRGKVTRSRAKLVLIGAEGHNKTEKIYFNEVFRIRKSTEFDLLLQPKQIQLELLNQQSDISRMKNLI